MTREEAVATIKSNGLYYVPNDTPVYTMLVDAFDIAIEALSEPKWNNHTVACLLTDLFGDDRACNYNGIDEWLPNYCEVIEECPHPKGVACWEQFVKHWDKRGEPHE